MKYWNCFVHSGPLNQYQYPVNKEHGTLLKFLQQIDSVQAKRIHITDVSNWVMPDPDPNYDIYIVCAFGEFINENYCHKLDQQLSDRKLILLTSQYYNPCELKNFTVFTIEHLHTAARFFKSQPYLQLNQRRYQNATQSRRNALHKSLITQRLMSRFSDLQYTFCNIDSQEYRPETFEKDLREILAMTCTHTELQNVMSLHANPRVIPGSDWDITELYTHSKLFWATESIFLSRESCPTAYLTEKTLKPIVSGCAWIVCGQQHSYHRIRGLGFETFESDFGIDFDNLNDQQRMTSIYALIDNFDFDSIIHNVDIQEKIDYNYNHFFNNFVDHVQKQNEPVIQEFLDYVNTL